MNKYEELKGIYENKRTEIGELKEAEKSYGQIVHGSVNRRHPAEKNYHYGMHSWTKVSISTIILAAEKLGWKEYIDLLGKYQFPAQIDRAEEIAKKYHIPKDTFAGFIMTAILWGQGCGFDLSETGCQPIYSQHELSWNMGDKCPQIDALEEMGLVDKSENLYIWCDAYDDMICSPNGKPGWYSHLKCCGMKGCDHCASYMHDMDYFGTRDILNEKEGESHGEDYYGKIMRMKKRAMELYESHPEVKNWRAAPFTDNFIQGYKYETFTPVERAKDGTDLKSRIAMESIIVAAKAMGWENFINASEEMLSWGFSQGAKDAKAWTGVRLSDMMSACELVSSMFFMLGFDDHQITEYNSQHVTGFAPRCKAYEIVDRLGLLGDAKDFHLWCDFYHNFFVQQLNPDYRITFTHCLLNGDPECKFEIYMAKED